MERENCTHHLISADSSAVVTSLGWKQRSWASAARAGAQFPFNRIHGLPVHNPLPLECARMQQPDGVEKLMIVLFSEHDSRKDRKMNYRCVTIHNNNNNNNREQSRAERSDLSAEDCKDLRGEWLVGAVWCIAAHGVSTNARRLLLRVGHCGPIAAPLELSTPTMVCQALLFFIVIIILATITIDRRGGRSCVTSQRGDHKDGIIRAVCVRLSAEQQQLISLPRYTLGIHNNSIVNMLLSLLLL